MSLLNRRDAARELLRERGELIVVAGLGAPAYDLASCGNQPLDFPLWGAMGGAAMVGLGLALAQPQQPVLVLTGDGEMLMGLGSLATIAVQHPPNLRIVVLETSATAKPAISARTPQWGSILRPSPAPAA
jgi:thiamine pyrophosphate-dependent acetolactate synthase large subunit-like protein